MLEARRLSFTVNGHTLLADVDLAVRAGCVTVLIGPNGAGKSTLLRALAGELPPTSGSVLLDGRPLETYSAIELARRRAVVAQSSTLAFPFTVLEVVMLGVTVPGFQMPAAAAETAARDAIAGLGLSTIADRLYVHLSGGERQRVHLARALCQLKSGGAGAGETICFLLDEPTASLDLAHQTLALQAIRHQAESGRAVLVVLHDLNLAAAMADELVLLVGGRVAVAGSARDVLTDRHLSAAYGCEVRTNAAPPNLPFVLPPALLQGASGKGVADRG
jgi:iron complex transport system ATP-binding protein